MIINIGRFLAKRAHLSPNKLGVICNHKRVTFRELNFRANQLANAMRGMGVKKGDRVAILMPNSIEYYEVFFGLAKIGAVMVPLNWRLVSSEIEYIVKDSEALHLIYGSRFSGLVEEMRPNLELKSFIHQGELAPAGDISYDELLDAASQIEPELGARDDDDQFIMYTSGTTGLPKGAVITHRNIFATSCNFSFTLDWSFTDIFVLMLPMFHIGGLGPIVRGMHKGATAIVMESFDPDELFRLIAKEKVTSFLAVPAMLNTMLQAPHRDKYDLSSLGMVLTGAAPVPESLIVEYAEKGIEIAQVYGLTESTGMCTALRPEEALTRLGSCGKACFHLDVEIADDDSSRLSPDSEGEIIVRGDSVMKGYWNLPRATAETIKNGWLHTGDVGKMDEEGYFYITDRKKDMIISGGENIYPVEIEKILHSHPKILEAAVIGIPSEKWGESPMAVVVLNDGETLSDQEVVDFCNGKLARFKMPKSIVFTDTIPRNPTGKILKWKLREQFKD